MWIQIEGLYLLAHTNWMHYSSQVNKGSLGWSGKPQWTDNNFNTGYEELGS